MSQEEVLTTKEAADFLKVSVLTLRKMTRNGNIPAHRMGRKYVFLRSEILEWVKSQ